MLFHIKNICLTTLLLSSFLLVVPTCNAQTVPTVEEVQSFFNSQNILITYREGEVVYGTYYFLEVHYCPNGKYGLYGSSVKKTVLGNEQRNSWQEFGSWQAVSRNDQVGMYYSTTTGSQQFVPLYKLANGDLFVREGVSIVKQGPAICY